MGLSASGDYVLFPQVAAEALRAVGGYRLAEENVALVMDGFAELPAHPDAEPAMRALADAGLRLCCLTNGSADATMAFLARTGLERYIERVISAAEAATWKPPAQVYRHATAVLGLPPAQVALVAVHAWDCHGAKRAGLTTGWASRLEGHYGSALSWGLVNDAPNSLVWEIGHTGNYTTPHGQFCLPGSATKPPCYSFNVPSWLRFKPLQIKGVTFGNGSTAKSWSAVSDTGGQAEVLGNSFVGPTDCPGYGGPFCTYPWYAFNRTLGAFTYGGDYPGTSNDFGRALQFQQTENCTSPQGGLPQYCSTILK